MSLSTHRKSLTLVLIGCAAMLTACAEESSGPDPIDEACGVVECFVGEDNFDVDQITVDPTLGKADAVERVQMRVAEATADGTLDVGDVHDIFDAAGGKVSSDEARAINDAVFGIDLPYDVPPEAQDEAREMAWLANLPDVDALAVLDRTTFGGTEIPEAVRNVITTARLNGAIAYDVNERDDDGDQIWTPYPATTLPTDNMTFDYTEITPARLVADMNDTEVRYNAIVGTETGTTSYGREYKRARYEQRQGGSGNILAQYDEVYHPDIYARGSQNQIWANNFAILSDGSIHCLPAARRSIRQDLILTNPHLSRGRYMMYNGHLDVRDGVVVGVEMSGRLSKLAAKGKATFVDPIALLEAWGFEVSPNVTLRFGNTEDGRPVRDLMTMTVHNGD